MQVRLNPHVLAARIERFGPVMALADDPEFINLAPAQHYQPPAAHILAAVHEAVDEGRFRYGVTAGEPALREAIADRLRRRGVHVDPATEIRVLHGAGHAFLVTLMAFLEPGDEVITADPSFPLNWYTTELLGATAVGVPLTGEGGVDALPDRIESAITDRTKALLLHPVNNPTGDVLTRSVMERIADIALRRDLLVLSDEVYDAFVFDGRQMTSIASLDGMHERTVTIGGFSKDYNLPGLRVGYLSGPAGIVEAIGHIQHNGPVGASVIGQHGALAALTGPQDELESLVLEFAATRERVVRRLNEIPGVHCPVPEGGFFVFPDVRALNLDVDDVYLRLATDAKIGLAPGTWYGSGSGFLRICYGAAPPARVDEFLTRLAAELGRSPESRS